MDALSPVLRRGALCALVASVALVAGAGCPGDDQPNRPPRVELTPDAPEQTVAVGDSITISVLAKDDDGDPITFSYTWKDQGDASTIDKAEFFPSSSTATFRWSPQPGDVTGDRPIRLIFVVVDGKGGRTEREVRLNIVAGNGTPRFENSANLLYTKCCDEPLSLEVKVRDDDTEQVTLSMRGAPEGATFEQIDGKKGRFTWTPTADQARVRVHGVTFVADDAQNAAVEQKVTIIIPPDNLNTGGDPGMVQKNVCAGEKVIDHTPLGAQRMAGASLPITATLDSAKAARYDDVVLFWTEQDPTTDPDALVYSAALARSGDMVTGVIPNPALNADRARVIRYKLCLLDSDAGADDPEAILCAPTSPELFFGFTAYPNDGACLDDGRDTTATSDDNEPARANVVQAGEWNAHQLCKDNPDFHSIRVRPGQEVTLLTAYPKGADVQLRLLDSQQRDVSEQLLIVSDCTGLATASLVVAPGAEAQEYFLEVKGDDVAYHVGAAEVKSGAGCKDEALEPNGQPGAASSLTAGQRLENLEICPDGDDLDVYKIDLTAGQRLTVTMNHSSMDGNLDMTLYSPAQRDEVGRNGGVAYTFSFDQDDETLTHDALQCGTYYLSVFSNDAANAYNLDVKVEQSACQDDDMFQCNHQQASAKLFSWTDSYSLKLCAGGEDWFKHRGSNAEILGAVTRKDGGDLSKMTFEVYNFNGDVISTGTAQGNELVIEHTFADDDFYFFRVASSDDAEYEMTVIQ